VVIIFRAQAGEDQVGDLAARLRRYSMVQRVSLH
jgi:hypothetical protein